MTAALTLPAPGSLLALHRPELLRTQALIGGRWRDAPGGAVFEVLNPANGQRAAVVADCDAALAAQAVDAAVAAFPAWRALAAAVRARFLRDWFDLVVHNAEDLARIMSWEQGKPLAEARGEVAYGASYIEWFAEEAKRAYGEIIPGSGPDRELMVVKEPVGVAAVITPWNFPLAMLARKLAPALAAGCAVVAKPAQETPLTALALVALAQEAGLPPGVINITPSSSARSISETWMRDPRVRKISFTGSTQVGKLLARQGADTLKRLSLELGGDAPLIVFEDADLDVALAGLMKAKFRNMGQACIAANRIYVQDGVYEAFVEKVAAAVQVLTLGAAADGPADLGPLINARAVTAMTRLIEDAVAKGARVVCGGAPLDRPGTFFAPTVLANVSAGMSVCAEEIFGPIVAIIRFGQEQEAVTAANDTPFGLAAYVFSSDLRRIWRVSRALETGLVGINEGAVSTAVAPFGGVKESGYGREGSHHGLADYQNLKYICLGGLS